MRLSCCIMMTEAADSARLLCPSAQEAPAAKARVCKFQNTTTVSGCDHPRLVKGCDSEFARKDGSVPFLLRQTLDR